MRPIFCGNFEYDARESEIERMFRKYGKVDRVDVKAGFAFVYMEDEEDARDAIQALDNSEFGEQRRLLRVEWAKVKSPMDGPSRRRAERRRDMSAIPSKTLFVINFDPARTSVRDLENHFEPYGQLIRVHIHKSFAFVEYESQDAATAALERTHKSKVMGREITVEYAVRENTDRPARDSRHAPRESNRRRRSPTYRRGSPVYDRYQSRLSPRRYRSRSPDYRPYTKS